MGGLYCVAVFKRKQRAGAGFPEVPFPTKCNKAWKPQAEKERRQHCHVRVDPESSVMCDLPVQTHGKHHYTVCGSGRRALPVGTAGGRVAEYSCEHARAEHIVSQRALQV